jgi:cytochrome c
MDSFELNKIIGAILGTLLFVMGAGFLAEAIYAPIEGRGPGYELPEPEGEAGEEGPATDAPAVSIGTLLASASVERGAGVISRCQGCHNFEEGAGKKQGPALYGVVGRQIASVPDFEYGEALAAMGAAGETWTYEHLNDFLIAPKSFAPKTKMSFGGLKNDAERADLIAYLSTLSGSPLPFPPPEPAEGATAEAGAAEAAAVEADPAAAAAEGEPVPTEADAIETPTETQSDSPVVGTPTGANESAGASTAPAAEPAPATGAAAPAGGEVVPEVPAQ